MLLWSLKIDVFCDKKGCDDLSFTSGTFVLWSIRSFQNTFIWWYVCLSNGVLMLLEFLDFIRILIKFLTFLWVFSFSVTKICFKMKMTKLGVGHFTRISGHFFAKNYINSFHKTEVLAVILKGPTCQNRNWIKSYDMNYKKFCFLLFSFL